MSILHHCFFTCALFFIAQTPVSAENLPTLNWWQRLPSSNKEKTSLELTVIRQRHEERGAAISVPKPILVACADTSVETQIQSNSNGLTSIPQLRNLNLPTIPNPFDQISQVRTC